MTSPQRIVARFEKRAMAVVLRNVASRDWGWFSREDERMHLQTVGKEDRSGPRKVRVWLETKGKRTIELAEGTLSGSDLRKLKTKIEADRDQIEDKWTVFMIKNDWIETRLRGSEIAVTAYPGSHNKFTRTINLRKEFPGAYKSLAWDKKTIHVDVQEDVCALAVGPEKDKDKREHIYLPEIIFEN